jgi:hypothetical protein
MFYSAGGSHCVYIATLNGFKLLTATCEVTTIQREHVVAFPWQQWLRECVTILHCAYSVRKWLRWSRGSVLAFDTQVRGFKPANLDFSGEKILSTPSFGGEVKPSVPCRALWHVKELKRDVEVVTFGKLLGHFSPIVPHSAAGFASVASDAGGLLWRKLERSKSLVLLQVGGLTCRWQRHSVKPSC